MALLCPWPALVVIPNLKGMVMSRYQVLSLPRQPFHMAKYPPTDNYDELNIDAVLEFLFTISDSALIDASFDGLVESRSIDPSSVIDYFSTEEEK